VGAFVGAFLGTPHLQADLEGLFEALEALCGWGKGQTEAPGLLFVPGGPNAKHGPPAGKHVERRDDLGDEARRSVDDARDQGEELNPGGVGGDKAQRRVGLEHLLLHFANVSDLPQVIHDANAIEAGLIAGAGYRRKVVAKAGWPPRKREVGDVQT
jgi:hypothetical protein